MRALFCPQPGSLEIRDIATPSVGAGQALIQVARASVCGTDIHKYRAEQSEKLADGSDMIVGHEPAGWVAAVGEGVTHLKLGQRVLIAGVFSCGDCHFCRQGYNTCCEVSRCGLHWDHHGCNSDYTLIPAQNAIALPDDLSFDVAALLTCAGGTAITINQECAVTADDVVGIIGLGPVGLSTLLLAKAYGAKVIGIDLNEERLALADDLGCDVCINGNDGDVVSSVHQVNNGRGCDVVAECVGLAATQKQAVAISRMRTRIGFAGLGTQNYDDNIALSLIDKSIHGIGIAATPIKYFRPMVELVASKQLAFDKMIHSHYPLEQASDAFAAMESGCRGKVLIDIADEYTPL